MTNVVLVSTYDMGRQPFALGQAAAWLKSVPGIGVRCLDLDVQPREREWLEGADLVAFYLPMHTATLLALPLIAEVRRLRPEAQIACFGLYAPLNRDLLLGAGAAHVLEGPYGSALAGLARSLSGAAPEAGISPTLAGQPVWLVPDRDGLPPAEKYTRVVEAPGQSRLTGYTETTQGCKHTCRHCPVTPVFGGRFRAIPREIVLADIEQQLAKGATHITFGDPDFFNGPTHGLKIVEALHQAHPAVTWDATIKVEHLLKERESLRSLKDNGCLFVTSAVESLDNQVLEWLDKGHTREDFLEALALCREARLPLSATFMPFTPWTTRQSYLALLEDIEALGLVEQTPPIQLAIRMLITAGSSLLELDSVKSVTEPFDPEKLVYPWHHSDPEMDQLAGRVMALVHEGVTADRPRAEIFAAIHGAAAEVAGPGRDNRIPLPGGNLPPPEFVPHLTENWFC